MTPRLPPRFPVRFRAARRLALAAALCALSACNGTTTPDEDASTDAIRRTTSAGPAELVVGVDRTTVEVGERIELTIDVTAETGSAITMPQLEVEPPLEIVRSSTPPDVPVGSARRWRHVHVLTSYEPGGFTLPSIVVGAQTSTDEPETLTVDPIDVTIVSVLEPDEADAVPALRDPAEIDLPRHIPWWWYAIAGAGAIIVIVAVLVLIRWMMRPTPVPPPPPPHERALAELRELAAAGLLDRGEIAPYYERLSWIVRTYLEGRYGLMAPERTTKEFLNDAAHHPALAGEDQRELASFLRAADMAKFAQYQPPRADSESALDAAQQFVERTTPAGRPDPEAAS